jgi:hypothetical protein
MPALVDYPLEFFQLLSSDSYLVFIPVVGLSESLPEFLHPVRPSRAIIRLLPLAREIGMRIGK